MTRTTGSTTAALRVAVAVAVSALAIAVLPHCQRGDGDPIPDAATGNTPEASGAELVDVPDTDAVRPDQAGPHVDEYEPQVVFDVGPPAPTLLFIAGLKGYTEPCGCTADLLLGGIDRVVGWTLDAQALAESSVVIDVGNMLFETVSLGETEAAQEVRKVEVILDAHRRMGTVATVPGPTDLSNGLDFYLQAMGTTSMAVLASNLTTVGGIAVGLPSITIEVGDEVIGLVGAVDPGSFAHRDDVLTVDALPAIAEAISTLPDTVTTTVLLYQGDVAAARVQLSQLVDVDFILIGQPRETDEVERIGSAHTAEAYDQGRYVGRLKLFGSGDADYVNTRAGSSQERERIEGIIEGIEEQLALLPPTPQGEEPPPIVTRQLERIESLRADMAAMNEDTLEVPADGRSFYFAPTPMEPGYPRDEMITTSMTRFNDELRAINMQHVEEIPPVADGEPVYVGSGRCTACHTQPHDVWQTTRHATAIDTLIERGKEFDLSCIGCHVTGYRQPGGSVLGNLNGLENVQCEQCHGPGGLHVLDPTRMVNIEGGVHLEVSESTCTGCHNEEHSPRFNFDTYIPLVLGPGHGE